MSAEAMHEVAHPGVDEHRARGREAAQLTPPSAHSGWKAAEDRPDPVALLEAQNLTREPDLVPVRHGRMMASPFTFYRGAAKIMAADLAVRRWPAFMPSCVAMPICRTSACSPPRNGGCCST